MDGAGNWPTSSSSVVRTQGISLQSGALERIHNPIIPHTLKVNDNFKLTNFPPANNLLSFWPLPPTDFFARDTLALADPI
jgi:hypothetical protein